MSSFGLAYLLVSVVLVAGPALLGAYLYGRHIDRSYRKEMEAVTNPDRY